MTAGNLTTETGRLKTFPGFPVRSGYIWAPEIFIARPRKDMSMRPPMVTMTYEKNGVVHAKWYPKMSFMKASYATCGKTVLTQEQPEPSSSCS